MWNTTALTAYRSIAIAVQLNHIREQREYQSRAIFVHISLPFRHANFCLLEDFLPSPFILSSTYRTTDVPRKWELKRLTREKQLLNIFILSQFLLIFIIGDEKEKKTKEGYMYASRDSMHTYYENYTSRYFYAFLSVESICFSKRYTVRY